MQNNHETASDPKCGSSHEPMYLTTRAQGDGTSYDFCENCKWVDVRTAEARGGERTKVTRFEVIDWREGGDGRAFVARNVAINLDYQDDGRTLKVFVKERNKA